MLFGSSAVEDEPQEAEMAVDAVADPVDDPTSAEPEEVQEDHISDADSDYGETLNDDEQFIAAWQSTRKHMADTIEAMASLLDAPIPATFTEERRNAAMAEVIRP